MGHVSTVNHAKIPLTTTTTTTTTESMRSASTAHERAGVTAGANRISQAWFMKATLLLKAWISG